MIESELIERRINRIPKLKPFLAETVSSKSSIHVARQIIKRLIKKSKIVSISRGIYVRPKPFRYLNECHLLIIPLCEDMIKLISKKTGEIIIHGESVAENYVGLSTQIPVRPTYLTTGRSRVIKRKKGADIRLKHINQKRIVMPGTITCLVVTALWNWSDKPIHPLSIKRIHERLTREEYSEVIRNVDKMPVWIKEAFIRYQNMDPKDPLLVEWDFY